MRVDAGERSGEVERMGERRPARARDEATGKRTILTAAMLETGKRSATGGQRSVRPQAAAGEAAAVQPAVTPPSVRAARGPRPEERELWHPYDEADADEHWADDSDGSGERWADDYDDPDEDGSGDPGTPLAPVARRTDTAARPLMAAPPRSLGVRERVARVRHLRLEGVEFIPGRRLTQRVVSTALRRRVAAGLARIERATFVSRHKMLLFTLAALTVVVATVASATGTFAALGTWAGASWVAAGDSRLAPTPTPTPPPPAPDTLDAGHYVGKYGFDWPGAPKPIPSDELDRMAFMLPFAYRATAAYDNRYGQSIEPEMLVWWTHSEGIGARINYSNCANHPPRPGTNYFSNVENCPQANFWQLGYGNQFSVIYVLKNAFRDLHGDPNDPQLVQQVGQWVLDFDAKQGTTPACGGYSCTFPALTIDQIMSGVNQTTGVVTEDNWWASVLSRDPAINCYMIAHALTFFNHEATRNWVGCYYAEPCWGYESSALGDVLAAWPGLRQAAHL